MLGSSFSADTNSVNLVQRNNPQFQAEIQIGVGYGTDTAFHRTYLDRVRQKVSPNHILQIFKHPLKIF